MLGIPELTQELRLLQQRADVYLPQLTTSMNNVSRSIDDLVSTWKADGGPTFTQLALQLGAMNANAAHVKELIKELRALKESHGADWGAIAATARALYDEYMKKPGRTS